MLEKLKVTNETLREALSEFAGTFVLVLFGNAVLASLTFDRAGALSYGAAFWGWGLALTIAVLVSGGPSGAHLNPALSVAFATVRKFSWRKILPYMAAQYLGAFLAAVVLFFTYIGALNQFDGGIRSVVGANATAGIFASYPKEFVGTGNCLLDQVVGTALLMIAILAILDGRNMAVAPGLQPLFIGLALAVIALCFGYNCGAPLNPARDLSPRIFTAIAGWGGEVFSFRNYNWFWVPIVGPHIGAILGAWFYTLTVELHFPAYGHDSDSSTRIP